MANMKTNLNYEEVCHYAYKAFKCPKCGKHCERSKKFCTMKLPSKSHLDLTHELIQTAKQWEQMTHLCKHCETISLEETASEVPTMSNLR